MNKYEVLGVVGEGAYGVVLKCQNKETNEIMAIKKFKESEDDENIRKNAHREVKFLKLLKHKNIVDLREAFRRKGKLYLVFEYVERNLLEVIEEHKYGLSVDMIRSIIYQLIQSLDFLHKNSIIHRDIKPENLLLSSDGVLKLCDFGFARNVTDANQNQLTDYVATRWYRPPELLLNSRSYDKTVDLWAAACIMGELIDCKPLFPGDDDLDQLYLIQRALGPLTGSQLELLLKNPKFKGKIVTTGIEQTLKDRYRGKIDDEGLDFMANLLKIDPKSRFDTTKALAHPFFEPIRNGTIPKELSKSPSMKAKGTSKGSTEFPLSHNDSQTDIAKDDKQKEEKSSASRQYDENLYRKILKSVEQQGGEDQMAKDTENKKFSMMNGNNKPKVNFPAKKPNGSQQMLKLHNDINKQDSNKIVLGGTKSSMEVTGVSNQPNLRIDPNVRLPGQDGYQNGVSVSSKKPGVKTLKTFYNPQSMNQMNGTSTTSFGSVARGTLDHGFKGNLAKIADTSKLGKLALYPYTDTYLGRNGSTNGNLEGTLRQRENLTLHSKRTVGNQEFSPANSHFPTIYHKTPNNVGNAQLKQLSTIAMTYNIPYAKKQNVISNDKYSSGGNGGGGQGQPYSKAAGAINMNSMLNSNIYNYTISSNGNLNGQSLNHRVATKVM